MDSLQLTLNALPHTQWRNVLHIGAGEAALEQHARVRADRLWFVEGDPQIAQRLALRCSRSRRKAGLLARPVAPVAGPLRWHCYNLEQLNGPVDAIALQAIYPRLQRTGTLPLEALSFSELLAQLPAQDDAGHGDAADLLILDVPGQDEALISSIPADVLARFRWIVARGGPGSGRSEPSRLERTLASAFFVARRLGPSNAAWPCSTWELDGVRRREHQLTTALARAHQDAESMRQQITAQQHELQLSTLRAAELTTALEGERESNAARRHRIAALEAEAAELAELHAARVRDLLADVSAARHEAQRAGELALALAAERESAAESRRRISVLEADVAQRTRELEERLRTALTERDALSASAASHGERNGMAARRIGELETALAEQATRLSLVRAELGLATRQLTMATDLLTSKAS